MDGDDSDIERPHRIVQTAQKISEYLGERQRYYAGRAQDFGYSKEVFDTVVTSFSGVSDHPIFSATEKSFNKFQELLLNRETQADALWFDVSSAAYAITSTSTSTASMITSVDLGTWIPKTKPPTPPPHWSKDRVEQYASKLDTLDTELGKLIRSVWQTFYGGIDSFERSSLFLMRQLYDHFFSKLAPDEEVRSSSFFKVKEGSNSQQVHRKERLHFAVAKYVTDKALGELLSSEVDQVLGLYGQLNRLHARSALESSAVRDILISMQSVIEQWVDEIGL